MRYSNSRIWITGASSGIGKALAEAFLSAGARVVLTARREEKLIAVKKAAPDPEKAIVLPGDMADLMSLDRLSEASWEAFGGLDMVILNAGQSQRSLFKNTAFDTGRKLFDVNYFSQVKIVSILLPKMEKAGGGHIVGVSSLSGLIGSPLRSYYSSAKHALQGFYNTLRPEVHASGIRVSQIIPGFIKTDISFHAVIDGDKEFGEMDPLQAAGKTADRFTGKILRQLARGKREIYIGYTLNAALARFLGKFFPGILSIILRKVGRE